MDVVVCRREPAHVSIAQQGKRCVDGGALVVRPRHVAGVGGNEQCGDGNLGIPLRRAVRVERLEDHHVSLEGQPRGNRAIISHLKICHRADDPRFGPTRLTLANPSLHRGDRCTDEPRWRKNCTTFVPCGETIAQLNEPAVNSSDRTGEMWMGRTKLDDDVASPGLAHHDGPNPSERCDQRHEISDNRVKVVALIGLARPPVTTLIHCHNGMAGGGQHCSHPVPHSGVRGEAVHEQKRDLGAIHVVGDNSKLYAGCDLDHEGR